LRSRVAICLHANWHQAEDGDQAKGGDTKGESQLDQRKGVDPPQAKHHFL
jgi:hypothetical protein